MALNSLAQLARYKNKNTPFPPEYPVESEVTLYAPLDNVHGALLDLYKSVTKSFCLAMFGFDDDELADVIMYLLDQDYIYVQLSLDSTQAAGKHESALLDKMKLPSNNVSFGNSGHGGIMHLKMCTIDLIDRVSGSTNLSDSGERKQSNELTVIRHPVVAAEARYQLDMTFAAQLTQMQAKAEKELLKAKDPAKVVEI